MDKEKNPDDKIKVIRDYVGGKVTRMQAANMLKCRQETVSRLSKQLLTGGETSFTHGNKGRVSEKRISKELEDRIVNLFNTEYHYFNFSHFYDALVDYENIDNLPHKMTVRRVLERNNIKSKRSRNKKKEQNIHPVRNRRSKVGSLVQLDASYHDWFATGIKCTLYVAIDDATSMILAAYFETQETLHGYYQLFHQILLRYGIPKCFYTDNRTVFTYNSRKKDIDAKIQFKRACNELGTDIITTSIAQAKGRVERSFSTHQDRLIAELRVHNIKTIDEANVFLEQYIDYHNKRFAIPPSDSKSTSMPLPDDCNLNYVLSVQHTRKMLNGNIISYMNTQYMPMKDDDKPLLLNTRTSVEVVTTFDNKLLIKHNAKYYKTKLFRHGRASAHTPPRNHPWKQGYGMTIKEQDKARKHRHK
jgi:hypothetical protein